MAKQLKFQVRLDVNGKPQVTQATMAVADLERQIDRASSKGKNLGNGMGKGFGGLGDIFKGMKGGLGGISDLLGGISPMAAAATAGIAAAGKALYDVGSECVMAYAKIQDLQVSFETLTGSVSLATDLLDQLRQYGNTTPYDTEGLAQAARLMLSYGMSLDEVMPTMRQLGDISMGDNQKLQSMTLAFAQMSAAGKVAKQDLNQMVNAGFNPLQQISEKTGESMGVLLDKVSAGAISVDEIKQAFRDATAEGGKFHNMAVNMSDTVNGKLSTMEDEWESLKAAVGELIAPSVISGIEALTSVIQTMANVVTTTADAYRGLRDSIRDAQMEANGDVSTGRRQKYEKATENALTYAKNKGKSGKTVQEQLAIRNKAISNAIAFETNGKGNKNSLANKDYEIKAMRNYISSVTKEDKKKAAQRVLNKLLEERKMTAGRIAAYEKALTQSPFKSSAPSAGGGKVTTKTTARTTAAKKGLTEADVRFEAFKDYYKNVNKVSTSEIEKAVRDKLNVASQSDLEAMFNPEAKTNNDRREGRQHIFEAQQKNGTANKEIEQLLNTENGEGLSNLLIDGMSLDDAVAALDNMQSVLESCQGATASFATQWSGLATAIKSGAKATDVAGAGLVTLGQSLEAIGADGPIAKIGAMAAAIGQAVLGFATASAQAASLGPWGWLAFVGAGLGTLSAMISTIGSFATGGIVPGNSTSGDKLYARVNSGEMILNTTQQAHLFKMLNHATVPNMDTSNVSLDMSSLRSLEPTGINVHLQSRIRGGDIVQSVANSTRTRMKSGRRSKIAI